MRAKRAKAIRKIMAAEYKKGVGQYEQIIHPFTYPTNEGAKTGAMITLRSTGARRAYQIGKKIYQDFGVMPRLPKGEKKNEKHNS